MYYGTEPIQLRPPVQSITTVTYVDPAGATQTLASTEYLLDKDAEPGRMFPAIGKVWPPTAVIPGSVKVDFVTGYTTPALVPDDQKAAIRLLVGHYYANRESTITGTISKELEFSVASLMGNYRQELAR
jgi:uncharacterized phiE125 gp8 family phage protein